jgi:hypothetical protein
MSRKQILAIGQAVQLDKFEDEMVPHLRAFAPNDSEAPGDAGVRRVVRSRLRRGPALSLGLRKPWQTPRSVS